MKRVLWFSRHRLDSDQLSGLGKLLGTKEFQVSQFDATVKSGKDVVDAGITADVLAVVLPTNMLAEAFKLKHPLQTLVVAKSKRVLVKQPDGTESKVSFVYDGWK